MKTIKVSEATTLQLDWLVAKCEGWKVSVDEFRKSQIANSKFAYSTVWAKAGPIIERERLMLRTYYTGDWECAASPSCWQCGPTPLVATMRCYVASKLGATVEVPEELT